MYFPKCSTRAEVGEGHCCRVVFAYGLGRLGPYTWTGSVIRDGLAGRLIQKLASGSNLPRRK